MAYQITLTMSSAYTGTTEADNFTIIGKHCNGSPTDTVIATNVTKQDLINGVTYQVADTITGGTVTSTGTCTNSVNWLGLNNCGGDTPNPTPTATVRDGDGGGSTNHQFQKCNSLNGESPQFVVIDNGDWQITAGTPGPVAGDNITVQGAQYQSTIYTYAQDVQSLADATINEIGGSCDNEL